MKAMKAMVTLMLAAATLSLQAQTEKISELENSLKLSEDIKVFSDNLVSLNKAFRRVTDIDRLERVENDLKSNDFRYELFFQTNMAAIAADEKLVKLIEDYGTRHQVLVDSLAARRARYEASSKFAQAAEFINAQDSVYRQMYRNSVQLSLTPQTAKALERLKAEEKMKFDEIRENWEALGAAAEADPSLADSIPEIEDCYLELQSYSAKIQQAAFKPWIDRVKDYLYSIAAVSLILLLIVSIQARISSARQYKANMKKMAEQFSKKDKDIPSI